MAHSNWEADKMLDVYIYDYLLKRNLHASAKAFMTEGKVSPDPVAIDAPGGFLFEWWSVFWDIFIARTNEKHSEVAASYTETQQLKAREQQLQMQQIQLLQQRHLQQQQQRREMNGAPSCINSDNILGQSTANVLATKIYEERLKHPHQRDGESPAQLLDANRTALLKAASSPSGALLQTTASGVTAALQQVQARSQQISGNAQEMKNDINLPMNQRPSIADPSLFGVQGAVQPKSNLLNSGMNQGVGAIPLKGWPLNGIDQIRPGLAQHGPKAFMQSIQSPQQFHQFQLLTTQQQQHILMQAQAQKQGNITSSGLPIRGEVDPQRFRGLLRGSMTGKDGNPMGSDGSQLAGSPMTRASPQDQVDLLMKMKMAQIQQQQQPSQQQQQQQQSQEQQQQQQVQRVSTPQNQQQDRMTGVVCVASDSNNAISFQTSDQNGRKRKQPSSSGPANSTGTGNTAGPSLNSPPSTPSTHTPGDVLSMAGTLNHSSSMSKNLMMYGSDGTGGIASPSNQLPDIENFGEVGSLDDNVDSFLSHDDGDARDGLFGTIKRSPTEHSTDVSKGFSFNEFGCLHASVSKVVCCHFSSDGKLLASAGHDKKAVLWNMDTLKVKNTLEEHSHLITDVRFSPNAARLGTSSFDMSVRVWEAENPSYSLRTFTGHSTSVMSLDFHPDNGDILCSCDSNNEIRYWNVGQGVCTRVSKGGMAQMRFQPRLGQFLAAAAENVVSIFDVETDTCVHSLQGHTKPVHSVCWDTTGNVLASVSEDSVRVWSLASGGECIHELSCNGNKFHSCVFHPTYSSLLVIGCYQSLELWNMAENKTMTLPAHDGLIAALAVSPATGMVASASHDRCVRLWK